MTRAFTGVVRPDSPPSTDPAPRPRDAATLVLHRRGADGRPEVLMGLRHGKHRFMPDQMVFPGGRVDATDSRFRAGDAPREDVLARLQRSTRPGRARALALAAVRELYEETGLRLARPGDPPRGKVPENWREFCAGGYLPALDRLDYVGRAITPPIRPIRFDVRFFLAEAREAIGEPAPTGEFTELVWVPIEEHENAKETLIVTRIMLGVVREMIANPPAPDPARPVPLFRMRHGRREFTEE
ncbi:NUDIX hydrolase [Oceanibacterium hippocampi]|uniref:NUDIX domain protein n=1 Tax=Oceanibacterium hippocampi TaxID=745714 RepID=A0A1Y5SS59_9PROT|nr:NUDIX domain-containing protein [Oceanibacterium hippocampi]SLN44018.1 NUDIX domain protein [Oceanibacterium hippocampi]